LPFIASPTHPKKNDPLELLRRSAFVALSERNGCENLENVREKTGADTSAAAEKETGAQTPAANEKDIGCAGPKIWSLVIAAE
jgi:hypothetical protein